MKRSPKGRLELTWMGKDSALIPVEDGKYDYSFVDPDDPRALEVKSIEVLEQVGEVEGPTGANENLLVIGDSGDALRSLGTIPEYHDKYAGQVKLVYIDPPFNTEQTFEQYADQLEHSIWLTMMRDRIRDIKPLLAPDASVWVHLDDAEVHRMRVLLDEEFGAEHFVACVNWEKTDSPRMDAQLFSKSYDSILCYRTSSAWRPNRRSVMARDSDFPYVDADGRRYSRRELRKWGRNSLRTDRPTMWYPITRPDGSEEWPVRPDGKEGYWRWSPETLASNLDRITWVERDGRLQPYVMTYQDSGKKPQPPVTIWPVEEIGGNPVGKEEIKSLFPRLSPFATPKPERLLERVLEIGTSTGDLVLDFFAGSGTTAAVAQKMGRRWIAVELQESTANEFISPRLGKVVRGEDGGGVTRQTKRVAVADLPDGLSPEEAQKFNKYLSKVVKATDGLDAETIKALRGATKTRDEKTVLWEGGGGFTVAKMGPSMYEVDDEDGSVYLSPEATNGAWSKAIAGQLKFTLTPDDPVFCGVRKRQRLAVIDGVADETVVRTVVEHLGEKEKAVIVAKGVLPEAGDLLQRLSPGSRIKKAPEDVFPKGTVN